MEEIFFYYFLSPLSWCRQLSLPTQSFGKAAQIPAAPRHEPPSALGAGARAADEGTRANYQQ